MVLPASRVTHISGRARKDFERYLLQRLEGFTPDPLLAAREIKNADSTFTWPRSDTLETARMIVDYFEKAQQTGRITLPDDRRFPISTVFLAELRNICWRLGYYCESPTPTWQGVQEWADLVCTKKVDFLDASPDWLRDSGFVSWLIFFVEEPFSDALIIMFDQKAISDARSSPVERQHAQNRAFMHEIGHACFHIEDFMRRAKEGQIPPICCTPSEEGEAWVYCLAVLGLVLSMGSRLDRILGEPDPVWKMM